MNVQIDPHTLKRLIERGATEGEIRDVVENGQPVSARHGRLAKAKVYEFKKERHGRYYEQKRVEVIYVVENDVVITVTAYVFYGKWE